MKQVVLGQVRLASLSRGFFKFLCWYSWHRLMGSQIMGSIGSWDKTYLIWQIPNKHFLPNVRLVYSVISINWIPKWSHYAGLTVMNDRNQNFCRYRNFGNFRIGKSSTDTDTKRYCIPVPKPVPIPKDTEIKAKIIFSEQINEKMIPSAKRS